MGRGGGSSGGSHRSSGGRTHYGSSRGGGSSSRGEGRSSYSGYGVGSRYYGRHYPRSSYHYTRGSELVGFIITFIIMAMAVSAMIVANTSMGRITKSTQVREKLPSSMCTVIDTWYEDDINWIYDDRTLERGLRNFYNETGVQPYLYITDNIGGKAKPTLSDFENTLQKKYDELFSDEGHVLVCFMESSPNVYATYYVVGQQAKSVIDEEAGNILLDYFDYYYTSDLSDEELFSTSFTKAAERMMTVTNTVKTLALRVGLAVCIVAMLIVVFLFVIKARKLKVEQAKADAAILGTEVKEEEDPLLSKYE